MFKQRVITAIVLVAILALSFSFLPIEGLIALFAVFFLVAAQEWAKLSGIKQLKGQWLYAIALTAVSLTVQFFASQEVLILLITSASIFWLLVTLYLLFVIKKIETRTTLSLPWLILGALVLSTSLFALVSLLIEFDEQRSLIFYLFAVVWVTDSGAYFTGKAFGKHKFSPIVSPGKTWEGVAGGVLLASVYAYFGASLFPQVSYFEFVLVILLAAWVSVFGDLFESLLKRQAKQKDSGWILPGHGGVLDRIDSMLAYTPVIVVGLSYVL